MKPARIAFLLGLLLILSGCIEKEEAPEIVERAATEEWKADGVVGEDEYSRSMLLQGPARQGYSGGDLEVSWKSDEEYIYMALNGSTQGWLSIGFEPLEWMKNADMILGSVIGSQATVLDEYCTGNYGPHIEDTALGGRDDIEESAGRIVSGRTVIELKRKLDTGDRFDKPLIPGQTVSIIWALSDGPEASLKHNVAYGEGILTLAAGQVERAPAEASALSARERDGVLFIWEEEKAARDLYTSLYEANNLSIFQNLMRSEQSHMDQAKGVMDRYSLSVPGDDEPGVFENQTLQTVHDDLLREGLGSDEDALLVAAEFEEISIIDLEAELAFAENEDVRVVYQGLLAGSLKHLRSYVADLKSRGIMYSPRHIEEARYRDIVE
ncbi:MAG: DUF2202 domain-containing protein [Methanothrix sp.]|jgi:hypothetical protein|nr:DUF2202 domain-containing protein [Methanothrix sp.]